MTDWRDRLFRGEAARRRWLWLAIVLAVLVALKFTGQLG